MFRGSLIVYFQFLLDIEEKCYSMYRILIFVLFSMSTVRGNHMPEILKPFRCKNNPDLPTCSVENGNKVIQQIMEGIPELHIPKLNPMEMDFINLIDTPTLHLNLTNIKIHGLPEVELLKTKVEMEKGHLITHLKGNNITIEGTYTATGKISVMPIKGSGHFSLYLKNGVFDAEVHVKFVEKEGIKYMQREHFDIGYEFDQITFNFENLFEGNPKLSEEINKFLNENWKALLTEFGPGLIDILIDILNSLFDEFATVPLDEFFLPD